MNARPFLDWPTTQRMGDEVVDPWVEWANAAELSVKEGDVQALRRLLQRDATGPAEIQGETGEMNPAALQSTLFELNPLHTASALGHREMVQFLVTEVEPWLAIVRDKEAGAMALHTCARFGQIEIAKDLLDCRVPISACDSSGCTAREYFEAFQLSPQFSLREETLISSFTWPYFSA